MTTSRPSKKSGQDEEETDEDFRLFITQDQAHTLNRLNLIIGMGGTIRTIVISILLVGVLTAVASTNPWPWWVFIPPITIGFLTDFAAGAARDKRAILLDYVATCQRMPSWQNIDEESESSPEDSV